MLNGSHTIGPYYRLAQTRQPVSPSLRSVGFQFRRLGEPLHRELPRRCFRDLEDGPCQVASGGFEAIHRAQKGLQPKLGVLLLYGWRPRRVVDWGVVMRDGGLVAGLDMRVLNDYYDVEKASNSLPCWKKVAGLTLSYRAMRAMGQWRSIQTAALYCGQNSFCQGITQCALCSCGFMHLVSKNVSEKQRIPCSDQAVQCCRVHSGMVFLNHAVPGSFVCTAYFRLRMAHPRP